MAEWSAMSVWEIKTCAGFLGAVVHYKVTPHYRTEVRNYLLCALAPLGLSLNIAFLKIEQVATKRVLQGCYR